MDFIVIPESAETGLYVINIKVSDYDRLSEEVSASFHVVREKGAQIKIYFLIVLGAVIFVALLVITQIYMARNIKGRRHRLAPHEYPDVPEHDRLFYEIVSDTIMQMRYRAGDKAIELAQSIDGLTIDEKNGRVLKISKNPAKIIALLVLRYETLLGKKVSFALRKVDKGTKKQLVPVDKNLVVIRKYFE